MCKSWSKSFRNRLLDERLPCAQNYRKYYKFFTHNHDTMLIRILESLNNVRRKLKIDDLYMIYIIFVY